MYKYKIYACTTPLKAVYLCNTKTNEREVNAMVRVGIIGATGYAGAELVRLLTQHKQAEILWYGSKSYIDQRYADIYRNMFQIVDAKCMDDNMEELAETVDVIFTATPQGFCASLLNEKILSKVKIIDLSADFRIKDVKKYEKWYGIEHKAPQFIDEAVYGLCEINREEIKKARLIANPGCYPTCSTLSIYPLIKEGLIDPSTIIIDAKSGTSGAGRGAKVANLFCEVNENIKAYGAELSGLRDDTKVYKLTIEQLNYFNDSIIKKMKVVQKELGIKDKRLQQLQYEAGHAQRADTIILKDTIFRDPQLKLDTIVGDKWFRTNLHLEFPSTIALKPEIELERYTFISGKRETVNPPKKFFLFRWFQKKMTVVEVNVREMNPYVKDKTQRFIQIIK